MAILTRFLNFNSPIKPSYGKLQFQGKNFSKYPTELDSISLSFTKVPEQAGYNPQQATHLVSVDFDGTLSTDIHGAIQFQKSHQNHLLHINTGRTVEDLASAGPSLKGLRIYAISTSNGEGLYINEQKLPGDQFIRQIYDEYQQGEISQDPDWAMQVENKTGWNHKRAAGIIQSFVWKDLVSPGYGSTECFTNSPALGEKILEALREAKINADVNVEDRYLYKFGPKNYAKNDPVQFIAAKCPNLRSVVVAGDSFNDQSLMGMDVVKNASGVNIPVSKVLMGHNQKFVATVMKTAAHPKSITLVPSFSPQDSVNGLFNSIERQCQRQA